RRSHGRFGQSPLGLTDEVSNPPKSWVGTSEGLGSNPESARRPPQGWPSARHAVRSRPGEGASTTHWRHESHERRDTRKPARHERCGQSPPAPTDEVSNTPKSCAGTSEGLGSNPESARRPPQGWPSARHAVRSRPGEGPLTTHCRHESNERSAPSRPAGNERQYTAPRAGIGQSCSTRLARMQTYQS